MPSTLTNEYAAVPELTEQSQPTSDDILTVAQRKQLYRASLVKYQQIGGVRLKPFCLGKRKYIRGVDLIPRRKRAEDIDMMCRYYNGDQYGRYNDLGIYEDNRKDGDFAYAIPILPAHVEQAFIQLLKIRPNYSVTADDDNDALMGLVADMSERLGVKELDRVMDKVTHTDLYNMLWAGESQRFVGWQPSKVSPKKAKRARYEKTVIETPGRRECVTCKATAVADADFCPRCGSSDMTDIPGGKATQQSLVGYDEVTLGENCVHIPHMLAIQRDMSAVEPEDSTFIVEYSYIEKHVAEWEFQSPIEPTKEGLPIEMQLRFDLERGSNQTDMIIGSARLAPPGREAAFGTTNTGALPNRKQPLERHYWDPSEYGQFYFTVDEQLPNGKIIKAGTIFGDVYPDGIRLIICGDSIMDIEPYEWRRKVTIVRYGRIAGTNRGAGQIKLMPMQDAKNDNFNLSQTVKHTVGHPLTVINGQFVSELPGAGNVLKITKAGVTNIDSVVRQYPGQSMSQGDGADMIIDGAMQFIAGTSTLGGGGQSGAPDMRAASTATGVAAMQEMQQARQSGPADQRMTADREMILQLLENIQEFSSPEQKEELRKRFGRDVADAFFACNLRQTMTVGIKANSDQPRSMALTQANYIAFGNILGQIAPAIEKGSALAPYVKEFLDDMATSMGFPFSMGEGRRDRREAEYRLNLLNDIEAQMTQQEPQLLNNPIAFAAAMHQKLAMMCAPLIAMDDQTPPGSIPLDVDAPRVLMQDHATFQDVYADWLFGERAKSSSQARKLVVIQLWLDHAKADMSKQMVEANLQGEVQAAMAPPEPPTPQQNQPTHDQVMAQKQQDAANEANMAAATHESDRQTKDEDLQRAQALEQTKGMVKSQLEQERLAAQPQGAAKLIESMTYDKVQPDIQDQMAARAGFEPSQQHEPSDAATKASDNAHEAATQASDQAHEVAHTVLEHHLDEQAANADVGRQIQVEKSKPKPKPAAK